MKRIAFLVSILMVLILLYSCKDEEYTTKSSIYGIIIEASDNTPIEGAVVTNQTNGKNCITPKDGSYEFQNLNFGETYKIYVEKDGYIPATTSITPSDIRDRIELNIKISKRPK